MNPEIIEQHWRERLEEQAALAVAMGLAFGVDVDLVQYDPETEKLSVDLTIVLPRPVPDIILNLEV